MKLRRLTSEEYIASFAPENQEKVVAEIDLMLEGCSAVLRGHSPAAQGYVTARLVAMFINGHQPPEVRRKILAIHLTMVKEALKVDVED